MKFPRHLGFIFLVILGFFCGPAVAQNTKENADFKLAINLYGDGLYDLAAEQLKQFISAYPSAPQSVDARFYLGLTELKLKKFDDARVTFQTFALNYQDNPKAPEAWWNVGEAYAALHNDKEAALAFERVKVFHPKSKYAPDALLQAAKYFSRAGEEDNSRRVLRTILQEYPQSNAVPAARTQIGRLYFEEGNLSQAETELKRVIQEDPSPDAKAQALLVLGTIAEAVGKFDEAQADYQLIIRTYKKSSALQGAELHTARLQASAGQLDEAVQSYKKALAEKTADSSFIGEGLMGLGDAQTARGDFAGAVGSYERFLRAFPGDSSASEVLWKLALAASEGKSFSVSDDACFRILKGTAAGILQRKARIRLALNAEEQRVFPLAIQHLENYTEQYPDDPATPAVLYRIAGLDEKELHDPGKAAPVYELLASRYRSSPFADDAIAGAARCHEQMGEFGKALELYRELRTTYPSSDLRASADDRIRDIEVFEAKDKDAGLEKLALLIGDVVADKNKAGLSYRLGDIYFHDLKNYSAAAAQFSAALSAGLDSSRANDALFMKARSLAYLSRRNPQYRPQAIVAYQDFLNAAPADPRGNEAALAVYLLSATTPDGAAAAFDATVALHPAIRRDTMLLRLGILLEQSDSAAQALDIYSRLGKEFPHSPSAQEASYRRFRLLARLGLAEPAMAQGDSYLAAYPGGMHAAEILNRLGRLALLTGHADKAVEDFSKLANRYSYAAAADSAQYDLAQACIDAGDGDAAVNACTDLLNAQLSNPFREDGPDPELLLRLGKACRLAGKPGEAKRYLFQLLARRRTGPVAGDAYATLGAIFRQEGSLDIATAYFRQAGQASPESAVNRDVADLLFSSGNYADAARQYERLAENAANDSLRRTLDARAIVSQLRNDDLPDADKAIAAFGKKYGDDREDAASFELERGNLHFRNKRYAAALKSFERVVDDFDGTPSAPTAMYWIGKTHEATGQPQDALKELKALIADHPDAPVVSRAYFALGNIFYNAEKWDESIRNYRRVVEDTTIDPVLLAAAMSNLIETYEMAGLFDAALSLTRKYLDRFPNNDDAIDKKIKIGILYERLGYFDQAILQLQNVLDEAGSDLEAEIRYYIAEANYEKGDFQQAILDFLKVPYLVTKKGKLDWTANSLYMAGQSYEKMGRFDQALIMYKQIVERSGIDETFKAAARKEIDRVKLVLKQKAD